MGPKKGKKKGKKSSSGGGGKKKEAAEESVTFNEAVMTYQLEVKQMTLSSLKENIEELKAKNEREKQRNQYLRKEQNRHVKDVIVSAQENEIAMKEVEQIPYEDVEKALHEKLSAICIEENSVEERKEKIKLLDEELKVLSEQLKQLNDYKDHGQTVDKTHIQVLLKEMDDMDKSYAEMANFFDKSLATMKQTITKQNHGNIAVQKNLASEEVIKNLDKHTEQEFLDNEWLLKEVSIHRNHIIDAEVEIKRLEKQNIEVMSYLFEQQVEDLKQTKKFYLACKEEDNKENGLNTDEDSDQEIIEEHGNVGKYQELPDDLKWLDNYLHEFDSTATEDDFKLGPVEVKLLRVIGNKLPLHDISEMSADGLLTSSKSEPHYKWIVEKDDLRQSNSCKGL